MSSIPVLAGPPASGAACGADVLSASKLAARVGDAARLLPRGGRVAVQGGSALSRLCWLLAADRADCAALLPDASWPRRERDAVLDDARPSVLVDAAAGAVHPLPGSPDPAPVPAPERVPFYLAGTSGSSGRPRVLQRSRGSWLRSFDRLGLDVAPGDRVLVPGPLSSSLFLFGALHALHAGAEPVLLEEWSAEAAARAATGCAVVHLVPAMLSALLAVLERDPALREACLLRTAVCAGARLDPGTRRRLRAVLPDCALLEYYGSAEQSLIAVGRDGPLHPVVPVHLDADGLLSTGTELAADGYLQAGDLVVPPEWAAGRISVGDRAQWLPDGALQVLGRSGTAIDSGGALIDPEEVEDVLRGCPGVRDVLVSATPHPRFGSLVTALIEPDPQRHPSTAELRRRCREALEPAARPRRWLAPAELPRTASGKPARALAAERLRDGDLPAEPL
ncbi:AMP-binding protein [Saccharopolyspora sp. HNM0983]|uniref:AMP-binding protein n=1 Tax=Saccharopolyspora montiporae TaxID=2781240 RepID=A0A929BEL1_9PSEU|nr:AMP-binding protein [Saccharopolyspora sp. HNM0983]MBE9376062.1 AMP-binding protein [Saccharopolyspora sp. HNM0983]